jgi:hypothetical protein
MNTTHWDVGPIDTWMQSVRCRTFAGAVRTVSSGDDATALMAHSPPLTTHASASLKKSRERGLLGSTDGIRPSTVSMKRVATSRAAAASSP